MATDTTPPVVLCSNGWRHGTAKTPPAVALVSATDDTQRRVPRCRSCVDSLQAAYQRRPDARLEVVALDQPAPNHHHNPDPDDDDDPGPESERS